MISRERAVSTAVLSTLVILSSLSHDIDHCTNVNAASDNELPLDTASFLQHRTVAAKADNQTSTATGRRSSRIPMQLVMTGNFSSVDDLPLAVQANLNNTRALAGGFSIRYLDDADCSDYLSLYFNQSFQEIYDTEIHGSHRGDICRSAVLYREGGFYADLDFQFYEALPNLIDENTTLMTAFIAELADGDGNPILTPSEDGSVNAIKPILNALIAVRQGSPIMERTLSHILKLCTKVEEDWAWGGEISVLVEPPSLLGPIAMAEALRETLQQDCPKVSLSDLGTLSQWTCGEESIRLYQEEHFGAGDDCKNEGPVVCSEERAASDFDGSHYGVFRMGNESRSSRLIGWPRYQACSQLGCGINGGLPSLVEKRMSSVAAIK
jgi:hypothetical protein